MGTTGRPGSSLERLLRHWLFVGLAVSALHAGCGGVAIDSGNGSGDDGDESAGGKANGVGGRDGSGSRPIQGGRTGSGGRLGSGGVPTKPPPLYCGNGAWDYGEQCDGGELNGATCSSVTMATRPRGSLRCRPDCTYDMSGCLGGGGAGGAVGSGGFTGSGGMPGSWCFDAGGVPDPNYPSTCLYGTEAVAACFRSFSSSSQATGPDCGSYCGCNYCTAPMAACGQDFACEFIVGCAQVAHCDTLASCYQDQGCAYVIDQAGGRRSAAAQAAQAALRCMTDSGCRVSCQ